MIALALSVLVLLAFQLLMPKPPPRPATVNTQPAVAQTQPTNTPTPAPVDDRPKLGEVIGESSERTLELTIGTIGEPGSYRARFTNRGAQLLELKLANFVDQVGLRDEDRLAPEHWTTLLASADSAGVKTGSMVWRSDASSTDLERGPIDSALWRMRPIPNETNPTGVEFDLAQGSGVRLIKRLRFEPGTYRIQLELELENLALEGTRRIGYLFTPAEVVPLESGDRFYVEPQAIAAARSREDSAAKKDKPPTAKSVPRDDRGKEVTGRFEIPEGDVSFAGVHNKYFAYLMRGADPYSQASIVTTRWRRLRDDGYAKTHPDKAADNWRFMASDLVLEFDVPPRGETRKYAYAIYAGPKDRALMEADWRDHEVLADSDLGSFLCMDMSGVGNVLLWVLGMFHGIVGNWGVAIILLTICVRLALFPINRRSQTSMARFQKKMKRLQPQIDEIKKRHADDAGKQRSEQQALMGKEGAMPPLGGCLPVFVQIPVFFGLFSALRTSFDLRQAPFALWINDLSRPDHLLEINLNTHLPLIGTIQWLNILPILMVVLWVAQQMTMPKPADEQAARMQKMMMFMPVFMGFFLYDYAAGLSLYMITQSVLGIVEQTLIKKVWPLDDSIPEAGSEPKGWFARLMERAQDAQKQQQRRSPSKPTKSDKGSKKKY